jgi:hypothetical protein
LSRKTAVDADTDVGRPPKVLEVLKASPEARKEFYRAYRAGHRNILAAAEELLRLIREPAGAEVIYLIGATGVGKTTLLEYVIAKLYEMALPVMDKFPGRVPAAYIVAESPDRGTYDWSRHYINTMLALDEVLIDKKVYLPSARESQEQQALPRAEKMRRHRMALRTGAENTLMYRIMYAFFVDEAQFITKRRSGEGLVDQADTIRSVAARSKILHVLAGTYELLLLRNLSGQLGRRSHTVHFRRYKIEGLTGEERKRELEEFTKAFLSLQAHLPVPQQPDLIRHIDFCYARSLGCVGHVKSWFLRALSMALEANLQTVSPELFLKAAPKKEVWRQIAQEIADGESALDERDEELEAEFGKLGVNHSPGLRQESEAAERGPKDKTTPTKKGTGSKSRKGRRPFTPKPERYTAGMVDNAA